MNKKPTILRSVAVVAGLVALAMVAGCGGDQLPTAPVSGKVTLNNQPLTVYGDGRQTRTFTHVKDVVYALMALLANENTYGEVYNVGGREEISILEVAERIIEKTASSSTIELIPYDEAFEKDFEDMQRRVPGIEKINSAIGFEPEADFDTILETVIDAIVKQ